MNTVPSCDISLAITGSGGAGAITAGELLLSLAGNNGCFGMMRRSFGPRSAAAKRPPWCASVTDRLSA